jgi:hypothetical protein
MRLVVAHTTPLSMDDADDPTVSRGFDDISGTLNASSTVPATKTYVDTISLTAGAATIDLTSLTGEGGRSVTFNGLKVQKVQISCPASNTAGITFDVGASNGYNLFGADNASDESVEVMPGGAEQRYTPNNGEDVDSTHKQIDVTGTGTESFNIALVAG